MADGENERILRFNIRGDLTGVLDMRRILPNQTDKYFPTTVAVHKKHIAVMYDQIEDKVLVEWFDLDAFKSRTEVRF